MEIRWRDMDAFGHVNNAVFLTYLEEVRDEWLERALAGSGDVWDFFLARVAIDYHRGLTQADDQIVARCWPVRVGRSSVTTRETLRIMDGTLAAKAESVLVARDPEAGSSRPLTEAERGALQREVERGADGTVT
jgi:acyl-CoA thioester hydrolase